MCQTLHPITLLDHIITLSFMFPFPLWALCATFILFYFLIIWYTSQHCIICLMGQVWSYKTSIYLSFFLFFSFFQHLKLNDGPNFEEQQIAISLNSHKLNMFRDNCKGNDKTHPTTISWGMFNHPTLHSYMILNLRMRFRED